MMKHSVFRNWLVKGILALFLFIICAGANGAEASITMAWDPSTTNADGTLCLDLAGYKIYYDTDQTGAPYEGFGLPQGASPIIVPVSSLADPSSPTFTLSGTLPGPMYYITVTAYDTSGNESGYSNEASAFDTTADADHDGVPDALEASYGLNPNSSDSDGDGIPDFDEWGITSLPTDTDQDGVIDALDSDSDNDGASDLGEDGIDSDQDGILDRLDNKIATMATAQGKMSVVLNHPTASLIQTTFIPTVSSNSNPPPVAFPYGGVSYKITGITAGEPVLVTIAMSQDLPANAEYWKYDDTYGFQQVSSQVVGSEISFELTDGGISDSDHSANGVIEDPGYIGIPQTESVANTTSGGGGGCSLSREPGGACLPAGRALPDALLLLLPLLVIMLLKKRVPWVKKRANKLKGIRVARRLGGLVRLQPPQKEEVRLVEVSPILCVRKVSQNRLHCHLCLSSISPLHLLPHKNIHPWGLQTRHLMYRYLGDNIQLSFPYDISFLNLIHGVCSYKKTSFVGLFFHYDTVKTIRLAVIQINSRVKTALAYLIRIFQGIDYNVFSVYHIRMLFLNYILPVVFCCPDHASPWRDYLKEYAHGATLT